MASIFGFTDERNVTYLIKYFIIMFILQLFLLSIGNLLGNYLTNKAGLLSALFALVIYLSNIIFSLIEDAGVFEYLSSLSTVRCENIYNGNINYTFDITIDKNKQLYYSQFLIIHSIQHRSRYTGFSI